MTSSRLFWLAPTLSRLAIVLTVLICLSLVAPLQAQESDAPRATRADVIRLLGELPDYADFRAEMYALGFRGEKLDLAVAQAELVYRDPVIAGYVADRVMAAFDAPETVTEARGLVWPLIQRGLPHLSTRELRYYHQVEKVMMEALSARECGLIVRDRMPPRQFARVMSRTAARLNTEGLRNYYRIQAKAARLGVTRKPVQMSAARIDGVETRMAEALSKRIGEADNPRALLRAIDNLPRAGNAQACAIGRMFMDIVMDLEGQELRDALIYMNLP
ncbi:hypothetical protein [Roseovarius aestuariivivens]|uniref:hypothetical protein n=1 Tax=Roseovarius aestuariivivens TaxID=1888910 RepID=UPI00107FDEA4|nr:hypothetical protein [Roseovarius aestuariivivens]